MERRVLVSIRDPNLEISMLVLLFPSHPLSLSVWIGWVFL